MILIGDEIAGCVGFRVGEAEIKINSFYLARRYHNRGLGAEILKVLLAEADGLGLPWRLDVLLGSPADRFYERHGFVKQTRTTSRPTSGGQFPQLASVRRH